MSIKLCDKPAVIVLVWPTMHKLPVCEKHLQKAYAVANVMGFTVGTSLPLEDQKCVQKVDEEDKAEKKDGEA